MVEFISGSNNDILNKNAVKQQQELLGVERKIAAKNIYSKPVDIIDKSDISEDARRLYEKEQDLQKYKKLVLDAINKGLDTSEIINLINTGKYLSNDDLADSLSTNNDFLDMLYSNEQSA